MNTVSVLSNGTYLFVRRHSNGTDFAHANNVNGNVILSQTQFTSRKLAYPCVIEDQGHYHVSSSESGRGLYHYDYNPANLSLVETQLLGANQVVAATKSCIQRSRFINGNLGNIEIALAGRVQSYLFFRDNTNTWTLDQGIVNMTNRAGVSLFRSHFGTTEGNFEMLMIENTLGNNGIVTASTIRQFFRIDTAPWTWTNNRNVAINTLGLNGQYFYNLFKFREPVFGTFETLVSTITINNYNFASHTIEKLYYMRLNNPISGNWANVAEVNLIGIDAWLNRPNHLKNYQINILGADFKTLPNGGLEACVAFRALKGKKERVYWATYNANSNGTWTASKLLKMWEI